MKTKSIGQYSSLKTIKHTETQVTTTAAANEQSAGWTRAKSWNTGRNHEIETFVGAALPAPWGTNLATTGKVVTDIDAKATTVTDQALKQRRSITNGLGQLTFSYPAANRKDLQRQSGGKTLFVSFRSKNIVGATLDLTI